MKKSTFGLIVTTRGFFNPKLAEAGRKELIGKLESMGYEFIVLSETDTPYGTVETREDAKKCAKLFSDHKDRIDGIIVSLPNFGDEIGVITTLEMAGLNVPILVQACDDSLSKMDTANRRDSFCGKLSVCSNLYQYGMKFTNTTLHTCEINSEQFTEDIIFFDKVCRVTNGLRKARIAQIGTRPTAFQTVRFSEKLLQASGITIIPVDMGDIMFAANQLQDTKAVADKVLEMKAYGKIAPEVKEEMIVREAKLAIVIEKFIKENECVAGAVQCWDSVQRNYQCATCLPMSMLSEKGIPMACETDITGAVAMYALHLASDEPAGYLDWNNNYLDERDKCICLHCSSFAKSFMGKEVEIAPLDILGDALGAQNCFGACKGNVAGGAMTFAKVSTDDIKGKVKVYFGEGELTEDPVTTVGGVAVCKINNLQTLLNYMCKNGFEHHIAINRSNSARVLEEALGNYLGWEVYRHI